MDGQLDDQGCLYEGLPEMGDTALSLSNENLASASLEEENTASFAKINPSISDVLLQDDKTNSIEKCPCNECIQWMWDDESKSQQVYIVNDKMDVRFHKERSNGTAIVRCTEPMSNNQYWWEVKMTCPLYGTDVMIGVGTSEEKLKHIDNRFVSLLGMDSQTWGFSFNGLFHHNGQRRFYGKSFDQGTTIGVHLDLWKGTLSFYKDRKYLGVASSGLKGKTLYAMASSTAACSGMRIVRSTSFPSSLQFLCCAKLREMVPDDKNVLDVVDVPPGLKQSLSNKLGWLLDKRSAKTYFGNCCRNIDRDTVEKEIQLKTSTENNAVIEMRTPQDPVPLTSFLYPNISGQIILQWSVLLNTLNQSQREVRYHIAEGRESSPESNAKRQRFSYNYTVGFSDYEDEFSEDE